MRYLLDTHILIWHLEGNAQLPEQIKDEIFNVDNSFFVSVVSLWEVAIKMDIGKYRFDGGLSAFNKLVKNSGFDILSIKNEHMEKLFDFPLIHRDPFDRLLIATAKYEKMTLITADENIQKYDVLWKWR
jgi:PIN domain nuclease of toxin-antitoxin system